MCVNLAHSGNVCELNVAVVFAQLENVLEERDYTHFLSEVGQLLHDGGEAPDHLVVPGDCVLELRDLTATEALKQVVQPLEVTLHQRLQDLFVELNTVYLRPKTDLQVQRC